MPAISGQYQQITTNYMYCFRSNYYSWSQTFLMIWPLRLINNVYELYTCLKYVGKNVYIWKLNFIYLV
jgi:hypothetical protein